MKSMKNKLLIGIIIFFIGVFLAGFLYVRHILPQQVAENVVNNTNHYPLMPEPIERKIRTGQRILKRNVNMLEKELPRLNLNFNDLLIIVDEADANEVIKTINILHNTDLQTSEQAFEIVHENIHVNHVDIAVFKPLFIKHITVDRIKKGVQKIKANDLILNMSVPVAKATLKSTLIEKRKKIEQELDAL